MVWYPKKQKLSDGPNFPNSFLEFNDISAKVYEFCTISLNRSHLMLIHEKAVFIIDFIQNKWMSLPTLNLDSILHSDMLCKATSGFDKNGNKYVPAVLLISYWFCFSNTDV